MSNPAYPTLPSGAKPDSSKFSKKVEDPAIRTDIEGGYVVSRRKHTRRPRTTWMLAYTNITAADYSVLDIFYKDTAHGGSVIFDWVDPVEGFTYQVRFKDEFSWTYVGIGGVHRWDCSFSLEQA